MESNRGVNKVLIGCVVVVLLFGCVALGFVAGYFGKNLPEPSY